VKAPCGQGFTPAGIDTGCTAKIVPSAGWARAVLKATGMDNSSAHSLARPWLGLATAAFLWLAQSATAEASGAISPTVDRDTLVGGTLLIGSAIAFGTVDLLYFAHDRPMPIGLTVVQMVVGGILVPLAASRSNDQGILIGAAFSTAWFTGHGVYSVVAHSKRERQRKQAIAADREWRAACARETEPRSLLCSRSR
jgi:hypothetical protein